MTTRDSYDSSQWIYDSSETYDPPAETGGSYNDPGTNYDSTDVAYNGAFPHEGADTLAVGVTDTTETIFVEVSSSDSLLVGVSDTGATAAQISGSDTVSVGITEAVDDLDINPASADPLVVETTEAVETILVEVFATDVLLVSVDADPAQFVRLSSSDDLGVGITDASPPVVVVWFSSDTLGVSIVSDGEAITVADDADVVSIRINESTHIFRSIFDGFPPDEVLDAAVGSFTDITRRVDIYEADGETPFLLDCPFTAGSVSVDQTRDERRTCDLTLYSEDNALLPQPNGLWYDKIIKVYRGVRTQNIIYERQLGEFLIDNLSVPHFPSTVSITSRDYTKKLLQSKFRQATEFPQNHPIEEIVRAIAINGGIPADKIDLPFTGKNTGRTFPFDRGTERWKAIHEIATSYGYEAYFTNKGILTMTEFQDPTTGVSQFTFKTGEPDGNIVSYEKSLSDARLYNQIIVTGEKTDMLPVWAEAVNTNAASPTNVTRLGYRTYFYTSAFIETQSQAQEVADRFLKVHALEQFEVGIDSVVIPWLEAGTICTFEDPNPGSGDPDRYLLSEFTIPLGLEAMSSTAKRVTVVT